MVVSERFEFNCEEFLKSFDLCTCSLDLIRTVTKILGFKFDNSAEVAKAKLQSSKF